MRHDNNQSVNFEALPDHNIRAPLGYGGTFESAVSGHDMFVKLYGV